MAEELKPRPFCGDVPELPSGDGTQYEIECGGCGQAMASVQICDLMTRAERVTGSFADHRYGEKFIERAKLEAIERWNTRAQQSIQGGDAVAWRVTGRGGITVTGQYPEWAEADCLLTIEPLHTHPSTTPTDSRVVPVDLLRSVLVDLESGMMCNPDLSQLQQLRALLEQNQ